MIGNDNKPASEAQQRPAPTAVAARPQGIDHAAATTNRLKKLGKVWSISFVLIVAVGVFLRFYKIDQKEYWCDESFTSITVSGHTLTEFNDRLHADRPTRVGDLRVFQSTQGPSSGCLKDLIEKGGQHPPLYYALARLWAEQFGCGVAAMRWLPAILSLLLFPAAYWLCIELFRSRRIACIAVGLLAVSPNQVLYAQNAREYGMWLVLVACASATLLKCLRQPSIKGWIAYSCATVISFYTYPFSAFIAAGQLVFVLSTQGWRRGNLLISQVVSLLAAGVCCVPWALVMFNHRAHAWQNLSWLEQKLSFTELINIWNVMFDSIFVDLPLGQSTSTVSALLLATATIAAYFCIRKAERRAAIFLICMIGSSILPMALPDLLFHTSHSTIIRYLFPAVLAAIIAIAFATNNLLESTCRIARLAGGSLLALLIAIGIASCLHNSTLERHDQCTLGVDVNAIARRVNASHQPLFIVNAVYIGQLETLCRLLNDDVILYASAGPDVMPIPQQYDEVFLYSVNPRGAIITSPYVEFNRSVPYFGTLTRRAF